jgi:hypothetical protein
MMNPNRTKRPRLSSRRSATILVAAGLAVAMTACGSDDEPSAQEQYCEAGESLETSVDSLINLDLLAEGTDGLESAVDDVKGDVSELRDTATDASSDDVSALEQSVDDLGSAVSDLGGEITSVNVETVSIAAQNVGTAAQAVYGTLSDCG